MLAELFFLDTEPEEAEYIRVAQAIIQHGWTREYIYDFLLNDIAPVAGGNLGYGFYPVIGEWSGFDRNDFIQRLKAHKARCRSKFMRRFLNWYNRRFLNELGVNRLLDLIP